MIPVTVDAVGYTLVRFFVFRVDSEGGAAYIAVAVRVFPWTHLGLVAYFQAVEA